MTRTRSEYRMSTIRVAPAPLSFETSYPIETQRDARATLMLDACRSTIDDEGEDFDDACRAIDHYLASIVRPHSFVVLDGAVPVAFSFVVVVNDVQYIDPVVVASARNRHGLGSAVLRLCPSIVGRRRSLRGRRDHHRWQRRVRATVHRGSGSPDTAPGPDDGLRSTPSKVHQMPATPRVSAHVAGVPKRRPRVHLRVKTFHRTRSGVHKSRGHADAGGERESIGRARRCAGQ